MALRENFIFFRSVWGFFLLTTLQAHKVKLVGFQSLSSPAPPSSRNAMVNKHIEKRPNICLHGHGIQLFCLV